MAEQLNGGRKGQDSAPVLFCSVLFCSAILQFCSAFISLYLIYSVLFCFYGIISV